MNRRNRVSARSTWMVLSPLLLGLGGCGALLETWEDKNSFMASASPLCEYNPDPGRQCPEFEKDQTQKPGSVGSNLAEKKEYLGRIINESVNKCSRFLTGLTLHTSATSTALNGATTVFSALANVFTPLSVVHGLSAGATITSGWNGVVKSDIYGQRTAENYAQAIQASYYQSLREYMDELGTAAESNLVLSLEVAKIRMIHKNCSLASAQSTISATLQAVAPDAAKRDDKTVTVVEPLKLNDEFTLSGPNGISVTAKAPSTRASDVVARLVAQIATPASNFPAAGVTAASIVGKSAAFRLSGPASYKWTVSANLKIDAPAAAKSGEEGAVGPAPKSPAAPGAKLNTSK